MKYNAVPAFRKIDSIVKPIAIIEAIVVILLGIYQYGYNNGVNKIQSKFNAAEAVIDKVAEDWDSFYDVTAETDVYQDYVDICQ